jgi:hypothetical protein
MSNSYAVSGWSGIAFVALQVAATVLFAVAGLPPALDDSAAQASYTAQNANVLITVSIVAALSFLPLLSYALGMRELILSSGRALERPAAAAWGSALVLGAMLIVSSSLLAAGAVDASSRPDATAIRAFAELSTTVMTMAALASALFLLTSARGILLGAALPRWTGRVGQVGAALNALSVFGLYSRGTGLTLGDGGFLLLLAYILITSIAMVRLPTRVAASMGASA